MSSSAPEIQLTTHKAHHAGQAQVSVAENHVTPPLEWLDLWGAGTPRGKLCSGFPTPISSQ